MNKSLLDERFLQTFDQIVPERHMGATRSNPPQHFAVFEHEGVELLEILSRGLLRFADNNIPVLPVISRTAFTKGNISLV
jgi:hypothetical protein